MSKKRIYFFGLLIVAAFLILIFALFFQFVNYDCRKLPDYQHELLSISAKCNIIKKVFAI